MAGFAIALDTQASDLGAYKGSKEESKEKASMTSQVGKEPPVELWHMGLALLFLLLLAEAGLLYGRQGDLSVTGQGERYSESDSQSVSV